MKRTLIAVFALLLLSACNSWHGPAEVRLKDGAKLSCSKGLRFNREGVFCDRDGGKVQIPWADVAGYATK